MEEEKSCSCHQDHGNDLVDRKDLGIKITQEELNSITLVNTKISCARQAATPASIPDGVSEQNVKLFVKGALEALAEAQFLAQVWWSTMQVKYQLPTDKHIHVDFLTGEFYEVLAKTTE